MIRRLPQQWNFNSKTIATYCIKNSLHQSLIFLHLTSNWFKFIYDHLLNFNGNRKKKPFNITKDSISHVLYSSSSLLRIIESLFLYGNHQSIKKSIENTPKINSFGLACINLAHVHSMFSWVFVVAVLVKY